MLQVSFFDVLDVDQHFQGFQGFLCVPEGLEEDLGRDVGKIERKTFSADIDEPCESSIQPEKFVELFRSIVENNPHRVPRQITQ